MKINLYKMVQKNPRASAKADLLKLIQATNENAAETIIEYLQTKGQAITDEFPYIGIMRRASLIVEDDRENNSRGQTLYRLTSRGVELCQKLGCLDKRYFRGGFYS